MATNTPSPFPPRWVSDYLTSSLFQRQSVPVVRLMVTNQVPIKFTILPKLTFKRHDVSNWHDVYLSYVFLCVIVDNNSINIFCTDTTLQPMMVRVNLLLKTTISKSFLRPLTKTI